MREVALTAEHVIVGIIRHCIYMRRGLRAPLALVGSHHSGCVDREPFVWVNGDTEEARVCLRREFTDGVLGGGKRDVQVPIPRPTMNPEIFKKPPDTPCPALPPVPV